jgi:hypothetical protein
VPLPPASLVVLDRQQVTHRSGFSFLFCHASLR